MSRELATILLASVVGLTLVIGYRDLVHRRPRQFMSTVFLLALSAGVYGLAFPEHNIESKGPIQEGIAVAFCYVSMVLGMVAQYYYKQAHRGDKTFPFE